MQQIQLHCLFGYICFRVSDLYQCRSLLFPLLDGTTCSTVLKLMWFVFFLQIETQKLNWEVGSRVGSWQNVKHKAGGGDLKVTYILRTLIIMGKRNIVVPCHC